MRKMELVTRYNKVIGVFVAKYCLNEGLILMSIHLRDLPSISEEGNSLYAKGLFSVREKL